MFPSSSRSIFMKQHSYSKLAYSDDRRQLARSELSSPVLKKGFSYKNQSNSSIKILNSIIPDTPKLEVRKLAESANFTIKSDRAKISKVIHKSNGISYPLDSNYKRFKEQASNSLYETLKLYPVGNPRKLPADIHQLKEVSNVFQEEAALDSLEKSAYGLPAGRKDVILLEEWLDNMEQQLSSFQENESEKDFSAKKLVYNTCFQEIVRQVGVHCVERGLFMQRVWNSYIGFMENNIEKGSKERNSLIGDFSREMQDTQTQYRKLIDNLQGKINELQIEIAYLNSDLKEKENQINAYSQSEEKILNKLDLLHQTYQDHIIKFIELTSKKGAQNLLSQPKSILDAFEETGSSNRYANLLKNLYEMNYLQLTEHELKANIDKISKIYIANSINELSEEQGTIKINVATNTEDCSTPFRIAEKSSRFSHYCSMAERDQILATKKSIRDADGPNIDEISSTLDIMEEDLVDLFCDASPIKVRSELQDKINIISNLIESVYRHINEEGEDMIDSYDLVRKLYEVLINNPEMINIEEVEKELSELGENAFVEENSMQSDMQNRSRFLKFVRQNLNKRRRNGNMVDIIARRVKATSVNKLNQIMSKNLLLKYIQGIYAELLEAQRMNNYLYTNNLRNFIWQQLINKYGVGKVVVKRIEQLLTSCIKFQDIPRVHLFGRFLNLYEPLSSKELETTLNIYDSLMKPSSSKSMSNLEIQQVTYTPLPRALEAFKLYIQPKLDSQAFKSFLSQLYSMKISHSAYKEGLINLDSSIELSINYLTDKNSQELKFIRNIYDAADVMLT
jgi:hypothetical protein